MPPPDKLPTRPKFIVTDTDRFGNERIYARRDGRKTRLSGPLFSAAFWADYQAWTAGTLKPAREPLKPAAEGSLLWLAQHYYRSSDFLGLDPRTRYVRRLRLDAICSRPAASGSGVYGDAIARQIQPKHILRIMEAKAATPHAANADRNVLNAMFKFALARGHVMANPCAGVANHSAPAGGFHAWTEAEREQFRARHPIGTKPRLALELILLTGVRRGDLVKIGRPHLRLDPDHGETITFTVTKGSHKRRKVLTLPVLPALRQILDASAHVTGDLVFLQTQAGKPYSNNGFGNWFKRMCEAAGLPHCSAHGLRKLAATTMADNGATAHQLMAVFGWTKMSQAEIYTRAADQKRLARSAMPMIDGEQPMHKTVPLSGAKRKSGTNPPTK